MICVIEQVAHPTSALIEREVNLSSEGKERRLFATRQSISRAAGLMNLPRVPWGETCWVSDGVEEEGQGGRCGGGAHSGVPATTPKMRKARDRN